VSNEIETFRVRKYTDGITLLAQQKESRLRNRVRVENSVIAKIAFFDQIGVTSMVEKTTRHGDTPLIEVPHRRRAVTLKWKHTADLIDDVDVNQILNEPAGTYGAAMAAAAGRDIDKTIIDQFDAISRTGEDGATIPTMRTLGSRTTRVSTPRR
jgi:hypothetical protein